MNQTNLRLSAKEMEMIKNADWILTKNGIIRKTIMLLENVQEKQQLFLSKEGSHLPTEAVEGSPKISKGENYKGLPYLVLDYPRVFEKKNSFAIRTLFWWGNFFSITLHLSGRYKKRYEKKLAASFSELKKSGFRLCTNKEEWEHHFEKTNYISLEKLGLNDYKKNIAENSFIKLAKKYPLQDWDKSGNKLIRDFKKIISVLEH